MVNILTLGNQEIMGMIIMTFNIFRGGIDANGSRIEHIINVVNSVNPDFLALQEANNFDKNDYALLKRISAETNLPHYALSQGSLDEDGKRPCVTGVPGERSHVASLSRYPLRNIHTFLGSSFQCAALSVVVDSPLGELSLCNVHLHAHSEDERLKEIGVVLDYQSKFEKNIILGDCNALSRSDTYGSLSAKEFTYYDLTRFDATDMLNKDHIDSSAHLGVTDRSTHPTHGCPHPLSKSAIRVDYIWVTPSLSCSMQAAAVIKTPDSEIASDHHPLTLTLGKEPSSVPRL